MTDQQQTVAADAVDEHGCLDYYDVLVMRAIANMPRRPQRADRHINGWTISEETGLDVLDVRAITMRLEADGYLYRFMGLRLSPLAAETFGTALWQCQSCGCVDEAACEGGCSWVAPNLCSSCAPDHQRAQTT